MVSISDTVGAYVLALASWIPIGLVLLLMDDSVADEPEGCDFICLGGGWDALYLFSVLSPISLVISLAALILGLRALRHGEGTLGALGAVGLATLPLLVFAALGA